VADIAPNTTRLVLRQYMAQKAVEAPWLHKFVYELAPRIGDRLVLRLHGFVLERDLEDRTYTFSCDYPDGWVQALKKRLGLRYRRRRIQDTVVFRVAERYPNARIKLPEDQFGAAVLYSVLEVNRLETDEDAQ